MVTWHNWSGLESATPQRIESPANTAEVQAAVLRARKERTSVKMIGTGHSFTSISAPQHTMLRPDRQQGILAVDRDAMTVTAAAGTRLKDLNRDLAVLGLSLHNMGDIAEQTLAGAISTGTHGTGGHAAGLSAQVVGLELVDGAGEIVAASPEENREIWEFARLGLGALGVLTSITFAVEELFLLQADEVPMRWDAALAGFDELVADYDHVDAYWFPHTDRLLTKRNRRLGTDLDAARPLPRWRAFLEDDLLSNRVFGVETSLLNRLPAAIPRTNAVNARVLTARRYSDVAHRIFTAERNVVFREMEYAVPREAGLTALREVRSALDRSNLRISFPVELRVAPADDIPLSTAFERDTFYLAFHVHRDAEHAGFFALMEAIMRDHDGRPHWGKLHTRESLAFAELYPRFGEFVALRDRLDPDRVFDNAYLRRVLG